MDDLHGMLQMGNSSKTVKSEGSSWFLLSFMQPTDCEDQCRAHSISQSAQWTLV